MKPRHGKTMTQEYYKKLHDFIHELSNDFSCTFDDPLVIIPKIPFGLNYPWIYIDLEIEGKINLYWLDNLDSRVQEWLYVNGGRLEDISIKSLDKDIFNLRIKLVSMTQE